jgi:orotidine-5'-phosphate decarboxylase
MKKPGLIPALDVPDLASAGSLIEMLAPHVAAFKVGMELCTAEGVPRVVDFIHERGGKVFLDLKFKDIPNTVARAVAAAARRKVWMLNVHASGGEEMMKVANANRGESIVIAVTVLTSMDPKTCFECYGLDPQAATAAFAAAAARSGLQGVVCSPQELGEVNSCTPSGFLKVTPGTRSPWASANDQKRITTPAEAMRMGSDYLVIGRPITNPPAEIGSPVEAVRLINQELEDALHAQAA